MVICSISALHFDLPGSLAENRFFTLPKRQWEKAIVIVIFWTIGLLMPEIIVLIACEDYLKALDDLRSVINIVGKSQQKCQWTLKHSFFVQMGGFRVNGEVVKNGSALAGIQLSENEQDWKQIGEDISDKSKMDVLTKCISVIEIGRFLLAMIARAAASLPISPLEYFTCAQVVCALLMYIFWFHKPHNVQRPIRLRITANLNDAETNTHRNKSDKSMSGLTPHMKKLIDNYSPSHTVGHNSRCGLCRYFGRS